MRRLSNIDIDYIEHREILMVVEKFILQMKSSGYPRKTVKEAVVSGLKGWKNKIARRKKEGISFYRAAKSTLKGRAARNFY